MRPALDPRRPLVIGLALALGACGSPSEAAAPAHAAVSPSIRPEAPSGAVAPAGVVVRGEPQTGGTIAPVVEARGDATVQLRGTVLGLERQDAGRFEPVEGVTLSLRPDCETAAEVCISLVRGASLRPPAWNGGAGEAQCRPLAGRALPPGTYRFTARTCDGAPVPGEPFRLAP